MRLITWNINSVRLRAPLVRRLLEEQQPDVLCLQETKSPDELFPRDEFAALVVNVSPDQAETLAEAITEVIGETEVEVDGQAVSVGASVGVALIDEDPAHQQDVFVRADKAMYRAKGGKPGSDLARS